MAHIEPLDARTRMGIVQSIASGRMQPLPTVRDDFGRDISNAPAHLRSREAAAAYLGLQVSPAPTPAATAPSTPSAPAFGGDMFSSIPGMSQHVAPAPPPSLASEYSSEQTQSNGRDASHKPSYNRTTIE